MSRAERRVMVERVNPVLPVSQQCRLLAVSRSAVYRKPAELNADRRLRVERCQLAQTEPAQDGAHRRHWHAELTGDCWPAHAMPPQRRDLGDPLGIDAMLATPGPRAAVTQRRRAVHAVARQPAIALPLRDAGRSRRCRHPPIELVDPPHQPQSTLRRQARILVNVHPGDPSDHGCKCRDPQPEPDSPG
jgi:hypothetical protein